MATRPPYLGLLNNLNRPVHGDGTGTCGSTIVVVNANSSALNVPTADEVCDPWSVWAAITGDQLVLPSDSSESDALANLTPGVSNEDNIVPVRIPASCRFLDFYHVWRINQQVQTAPRIKVYGRVPQAQYAVAQAGGTNGRLYPFDVDAAFPPLKDFWVPLVEPEEVTTYMELGSEAAARFGADMFISTGRYCLVQGVTDILVFISQAASYSTGVSSAEISPSSGGSTHVTFSSSSAPGDDTGYGVIIARIST